MNYYRQLIYVILGQILKNMHIYMNKYKVIAISNTHVYISCIVYANNEREAVAKFQNYDYVEATLIES